MRRVLILLPFLLAACEREPAFNDRYDATAKDIEARAKAMDAEISAAEKANSANKAAGEAEPAYD
ncbi:hypothetical protein FHR22_001072 [Sphingopyxis panaciterrae]|uniref:hypothetical protein n=1 Tax=Sphingopyxis panaciterrae TaxID=363841 RepID=UPI001423478A|nr:hypothetical protein [Sphingopyxis panaciterrae]NIJ36423.1 hypothetical protein [Sphingopyxis panaciterrae]